MGKSKPWIRLLEDGAVVVLVLALGACLIAAFLTRNPPQAAPSPLTQRTTSVVNQRLLRDAQAAEALAETRDEVRYSREAMRLADLELDQAFASALREAAAYKPPSTGPLKEITDRVTKWTEQIAADQDRITQLSKPNGKPDLLELAKAQLALDQDELEDAKQDLARQGGDPHAAIARAMQRHENETHQNAQQQRAPSLATATFSDQIHAWFALRDRQRQLGADRDRALGHVSTLAKEHATLDAQAAGKASDVEASVAAETEDEDSSGLLNRLHLLSDQRKALSDLDKRIQDTQQLADIYSQWDAAIGARRVGVLHQLLNSGAVIVAILLAMVLIDRAIRQAFARHRDPRRLHHLQVLSTVAVQVTAVVVILLIVFGAPTQTSTMVGLATAGLTLVMKDFILSFLGWFVLMGKNGIRIGDWVEIRGVSGEVIEIGVFKTVLLEIGDLGTSGHVTGRRVSFNNSYAIEDRYFNFSTAGQWLWDELQVSLPASGDPRRWAREIGELVEKATEADVLEAEREWTQVAHNTGTKPFSAKPMVDLRPSGAGMDVIVRYITHAPNRHQMKSRLFAEIVDLLHAPQAGTSVAQ